MATRRIIPDTDEYYILVMSERVVSTPPLGCGDNLRANRYITSMKSTVGDNKTRRLRLYTNIVLKEIMLKCIDSSVPHKGLKCSKGELGDGKIGYDFVRIGLPKISFGSVIRLFNGKNSLGKGTVAISIFLKGTLVG